MRRSLSMLAAAGFLALTTACENALVPPDAGGSGEVPGPSFTITMVPCTFTTQGSKMILDGDCTTDATIFIPHGMTLDGRNRTITAVDPDGDHFRGAVVQNGGATAYVVNLNVSAYDLANACDGGPDRLRGIMFEGASGSIRNTDVSGINQGASGCQEGNAIEVRNAPFDGTHPNTQTVEISNSKITDYQKTGIVANGDVDVDISNSDVGASATQENLAANSIQFGFGALGSATNNNVDGNQWKGTSFFAASAILVFDTGAVDVSRNNIRGNSDVGLFIVSDGGAYDNNRVFDEGPDHPNSCCDIGIGNFGVGNVVTNNKIRGFDDPLLGDDEGDNKVVGSPNGKPFSDRSPPRIPRLESRDPRRNPPIHLSRPPSPPEFRGRGGRPASGGRPARTLPEGRDRYMAMEGEVVVGRYQYRHDAEMAQGYLKDAGIPSVLVADDAAGIEAGLMFSNPAELRVAASDAEKARGMLEEAGMTGDEVEGET